MSDRIIRDFERYMGSDELVDSPLDLYVQPEVRQLTDLICESIHHEVCEPYVTTDDGHEVGGAHQACEINFRHGAVVWQYMGMPRINR